MSKTNEENESWMEMKRVNQKGVPLFGLYQVGLTLAFLRSCHILEIKSILDVLAYIQMLILVFWLSLFLII